MSSQIAVPPKDPIKHMERGLARIGWTPTNLELDLTRGTMTLELKRADGRWVRFDARASTATLERFQRTIGLGLHSSVKRGSRVPRSDIIEDLFLGRQKIPFGPRTALRFLCDYLAENPAPNLARLPGADVRAMFIPLLDAGAAHLALEEVP